MKKQIQKALSDALTTGLEYVDGQLVGVRDRMNEAKASDEGSRTKVLQDVSHLTDGPDGYMLNLITAFPTKERRRGK